MTWKFLISLLFSLQTLESQHEGMQPARASSDHVTIKELQNVRHHWIPPLYFGKLKALRSTEAHGGGNPGDRKDDTTGTAETGGRILQAKVWRAGALGQEDGQQEHQHEDWTGRLHLHGGGRHRRLDLREEERRPRRSGLPRPGRLPHLGLWRADRVLLHPPVLPLPPQPVRRRLEDHRRGEGGQRDPAVAHQHPGPSAQ